VCWHIRKFQLFVNIFDVPLKIRISDGFERFAGADIFCTGAKSSMLTHSDNSSMMRLSDVQMLHNTFDDFVKCPHAALHPLSLRRTHEYASLLADLRALPANFLQSRPELDFLQEHHIWKQQISFNCQLRVPLYSHA
jgi:hypothetical protein